MPAATLDAQAGQPALGDHVRTQLVPVRAVVEVDLDNGQTTTVPRAADTWLPRRPASTLAGRRVVVFGAGTAQAKGEPVMAALPGISDEHPG
jgi:hypothetical protein